MRTPNFWTSYRPFPHMLALGSTDITPALLGMSTPTLEPIRKYSRIAERLAGRALRLTEFSTVFWAPRSPSRFILSEIKRDTRNRKRRQTGNLQLSNAVWRSPKKSGATASFSMTTDTARCSKVIETTRWHSSLTRKKIPSAPANGPACRRIR
jgi:hypothetical protein